MLWWWIACTDPEIVLPVPHEPRHVTVLPGPGVEGYLHTLGGKAELLERQHQAINSAPFGMSLNADITDRTPVESWLDDSDGYTQEDLEDWSGVKLDELVVAYGGLGDLGMSGGVAAVADAWRLGLVREDHEAPMEEVERAYWRMSQLMEGLHVMAAITGRPGSLARGLGLATMPGMAEVVPLPMYDDDGAPLPTVKESVWREDQSGVYPQFLFLDDTSEDQWVGYILALGAVWEVAQGDERLDPEWLDPLRADARAMGAALQLLSPDTGLDLTLIDADGRPTTVHDLNASELDGEVNDTPANPVNALLALAGLKVLAEVSEDPAIEEYYLELAEGRGYAELAGESGDVIWLGYATDYSNVNMVFTALHSLLRLEKDPGLHETYLNALRGAWSEGTDRAPWHFHSAWFTFLYAAHVAVDDEVIEAAAMNLLGSAGPPYWTDEVENCDEAEIALGSCVGVDGTTRITLYGEQVDGGFVAGSAHDAWPVASSYVPQSVRPASDFAWRSDPYAVNGAAGPTLNPGGDFRAAYWTGRWLQRAR